jgi:hypothetical protein
MKVQLQHLGALNRHEEWVHLYIGFAESGWAGQIEDDTLVNDGEYDLPDDMFSLDSGEIRWQCDGCGTIYKKRTRPGATITCPMCDLEAHVPEDVCLIDDIEDVDDGS